MAKKKYYAVRRGRKPGVYTRWYGPTGAETQVRGFPNAVFKGFQSLAAATAFLDAPNQRPTDLSRSKASRKTDTTVTSRQQPKPGSAMLYTDGGCIENPGPGGWGAVLIRGRRRQEFSGGYRKTTNNRMELTACIEGLKRINDASTVTVYTDSRYVADGIRKGWAKRWRENDWMRTRTQRALNADLWARLLALCEERCVDFVWVKGHAGVPENERCDHLAGQAARQKGLPPDTGYENPD